MTVWFKGQTVRRANGGNMYKLVYVPCDKGGIKCELCDGPCDTPGTASVFTSLCRTSVGRNSKAKVWRLIDPLYMDFKKATEGSDEDTTTDQT